MVEFSKDNDNFEKSMQTFLTKDETNLFLKNKTENAKIIDEIYLTRLSIAHHPLEPALSKESIKKCLSRVIKTFFKNEDEIQ